ncbi:50S ribosomal protein L22 [Candidatus Uhrbacteria bacterium RIFOXYB2_FULL_45_11]|uniref:Large ribosomal subunit protein uL22 n=1 Tax=Candidatus Uhrbacteria bacterium RIFOXYB2_FULL_45_11 TaxID=1802421 RepID=A0A1F7WAU7_9BACT|nr:MAG: 50S ribosomal protein L22 [Candidatus Uhrbacteria bacterium RIFOXYB2_FULL_45_11]
MQVKAHARHIRMSSRKVRLVIDLIRGARVEKAQTQLRFANKLAAEPVLKLLNSAIANAVNNFQMNKEDLKITSITADEGPILDRWHPRAHGRAMPIRKRSTHISIILEAVDQNGNKTSVEKDEIKTEQKVPKKRAIKKTVIAKTE